MTTFTIKTNAKEVSKIYETLIDWMEDFREPFRKIEKMQLKEIDEAFKDFDPGKFRKQ